MEENTREIYNNIADHFDCTRSAIWKGVKNFLDSLTTNSNVLDAGCGNGKNMTYRTDLCFMGIDFSEELIKICINKNLNVKIGDVKEIPHSDESFDSVISIAVIHHLPTKEKRIQAINETLRVTKPGGRIMIQVWAVSAFNPKKFARINPDENDVMVSWARLGKVYQRFYHLYEDGELESEVEKVDLPYRIEKSFFEMNNQSVILIRE